MERHARPKLNAQIYEEATSWFVESRAGDLDDAGRRELDQWLRRSPEHLAAYLEIAAIWNEGPTLDPHGKYDTETLVRQASSEFENVVPMPNAGISGGSESRREGRLERRRGAGVRFFAFAATILVAIAGATTWYWLGRNTYSTDIGEQRSIALADGSVIELNSRSRVRVHYTPEERDVDLVEGQALFRVAKDPARPFIVSADGTRVRAVGTQFDVYRKSSGTVVTVVEGRVAVFTDTRETPEAGTASTRGVGNNEGLEQAVPNESRRGRGEGRGARSGKAEVFVAAGEQLTVTPKVAEKTEHPNIASATAWTQRQLVFESATLMEVAEEFNRYNERQLVIQDPNLYNFHISGVFSSTDPESLIRFLRTRPGVQVSESSDRVEVSAAK